MSKFKNILLQTFTGKDNKTLDLGRILWAKGVFIFFSLSIYDIYRGAIFYPLVWGVGFGAVLAAGGAALAMKAATEPNE